MCIVAFMHVCALLRRIFCAHRIEKQKKYIQFCFICHLMFCGRNTIYMIDESQCGGFFFQRQFAVVNRLPIELALIEDSVKCVPLSMWTSHCILKYYFFQLYFTIFAISHAHRAHHTCANNLPFTILSGTNKFMCVDIGIERVSNYVWYNSVSLSKYALRDPICVVNRMARDDLRVVVGCRLGYNDTYFGYPHVW